MKIEYWFVVFAIVVFGFSIYKDSYCLPDLVQRIGPEKFRIERFAGSTQTLDICGKFLGVSEYPVGLLCHHMAVFELKDSYFLFANNSFYVTVSKNGKVLNQSCHMDLDDLFKLISRTDPSFKPVYDNFYLSNTIKIQ